MQVNYENKMKLLDHEEIAGKEIKLFQRFFKEDGVQMIAIHKPGSVVVAKDGTRYMVGEDGSWRRIDKKK